MRAGIAQRLAMAVSPSHVPSTSRRQRQLACDVWEPLANQNPFGSRPPTTPQAAFGVRRCGARWGSPAAGVGSPRPRRVLFSQQK